MIQGCNSTWRLSQEHCWELEASQRHCEMLCEEGAVLWDCIGAVGLRPAGLLALDWSPQWTDSKVGLVRQWGRGCT